MFGRFLRNIIVLSGFWAVGSTVVHAEDRFIKNGFWDINVYPYLSDADNDGRVTMNAAANFSGGLSYFGFINFGKQQSAGATRNAYYTEQNLRWRFARDLPLELAVQLNFRTGVDNDRYRLGLRWRASDTEFLTDAFKAIHLTYAVSIYALQLDHEAGRAWQIEHSFRFAFPYLSDRLYLSGFVDHNFGQVLPDSFPSDPIVAEAQFGYRLYDKLFAISEFRINEYRRSNVSSLGVGLQYKINW